MDVGKWIDEADAVDGHDEAFEFWLCGVPEHRRSKRITTFSSGGSRLPTLHELKEEDLLKNDDEIKTKVKQKGLSLQWQWVSWQSRDGTALMATMFVLAVRDPSHLGRPTVLTWCCTTSTRKTRKPKMRPEMKRNKNRRQHH